MCAMLSRNDEEYEYWYRRSERENAFRDTDDEPIISDVYYWKIPVDYRRYRYVCEDTDSIIKFLGDRYQLIAGRSVDDVFSSSIDHRSLSHFIGEFLLHPIGLGV